MQAARYFWEGRILDERTLGRSRWIFGIRAPVGEAGLIERTPDLVKDLLRRSSCRSSSSGPCRELS